MVETWTLWCFFRVFVAEKEVLLDMPGLSGSFCWFWVERKQLPETSAWGASPPQVTFR